MLATQPIPIIVANFVSRIKVLLQLECPDVMDFNHIFGHCMAHHAPYIRTYPETTDFYSQTVRKLCLTEWEILVRTA